VWNNHFVNRNGLKHFFTSENGVKQFICELFEIGFLPIYVVWSNFLQIRMVKNIFYANESDVKIFLQVGMV